MIFSILSCSMSGLEPHLITCEIDLSNQLPNVHLVGLPSSVTQESKERVRSAVLNSGYEWPAQKVVISLLPADLPKWGSHFELAMALGVLLCDYLNILKEKEVFLPDMSSSCIFAIGQLSLSGAIQPCGWFANTCEWFYNLAQSKQKKLICVLHPKDHQDLMQVSGGISFSEKVCFIVASDIATATRQLFKANPQDFFSSEKTGDEKKEAYYKPDFSLLKKVKDEPLGVAAALIAICGRHHVLFAGSHGMGKSMLIQAICQALPGLSAEQLKKYQSIQKAFGDSQKLYSCVQWGKPVVFLQNGSTRASFEGALLTTGQVLPGECTRAHSGVLVTDEFLEFRRDLLESLRQILDEKIIRLQRARHRVLLPADFLLLASTNLCSCGNLGSPLKSCRCSATKRNVYLSKLSGPLLDRMDMFVVVGQKKRNSAFGAEDILDHISPSLRSLLEQLADPTQFENKVQNYLDTKHFADEEGEDVFMLWSQISTQASDRGKLKMAKISRTISLLLGERRTIKHLLLAQELREAAHRHFLPTWNTKRYSFNALEKETPGIYNESLKD